MRKGPRGWTLKDNTRILRVKCANIQIQIETERNNENFLMGFHEYSGGYPEIVVLQDKYTLGEKL